MLASLVLLLSAVLPPAVRTPWRGAPLAPAVGRGLSAPRALGATSARSAPSAQAAPRVHAQSEHYELHVAGTQAEADELVLMLELCWPVFRATFDAEPELAKGERLEAELYATREAWHSGALAAGRAPPADAELVWFQLDSQKLHFARHPVAYVTRARAIHGACLQFHALAKKKNEDLGRAWYVHGIAEMLSMHAWSPGRLVLAASPRVCPLDPAAQTLAALGGTPRLWREEDLERPGVRWSLVRFARDGADGRYRKTFEKLALGRGGSKIDGRGFLGALGREERVEADFVPWLQRVQLPLELLAWSFEELPDGNLLAVPSEAGLALCRLRAPAKFLEATVYNGRDHRGSAGLLISRRAPSEVVIARFSEHRLSIDRLVADELVESESVPLARSGAGKVRVRADLVPVGVRISLGGETLHVFETDTPALGLAAFWNPIVFEKVAWE